MRSMVKFHYLTMDQNGIVAATAEGHATDVVDAFRAVCGLLLGSRGTWRITEVHGIIDDNEPLDSDMKWSLKARNKGL